MRFVIVFIILFAFWLLFSGHYDIFHMSLGVICSALIAVVSGDLMILDMEPHNRIVKTRRFIIYIPWLIYQVVLANIHVAYLVLNPNEIHPRIIHFKTKLKSDFSMVAFANSITLTPGTITMDIIDGEFYVHALSKKVADDLETGEMEHKVAHVFLELEDGK
ncbi:MAG: Na+/H+ antiporter subunit E [Proteobacteria bacterium]|nr:Na+/H+ antiporter subunit E [Pseudomonadota bacterium]